MNLIRSIDDYQKGDKKAFELIYNDLEDTLRSIKYMFNDEEIYDVVICSMHEIILKIKISKFDDEKYIINYIKKSLINRALDAIKANKKEKAIVSYNSDLLEININNSRNSLNIESSLEFYDLIKVLSNREKIVIERYFKYQESIADIAKDIGLSRQFVNKIKNNALIKLKKDIVEEDYDGRRVI
ncbi:hypothetical protein BH721_14510 [Clostridium baratii]|uniref:sigma-70 family RNA polymerase sigma factor n=1 Tax=Clostridium baratii TaxID=1561 RepID=UPI0009A26F25|nr:sigma-70 family RNA polymerase sigma factor [Clostridium baratii]OPF52045.1 hypothetical protein A1M12_14440 [Clostridium baratii]OPF54670.1 hypothetical protein BH721_14510 [Clostridium baratii]OPF54684.1 hypothetical protein BH724_14065 [Clostridium baratii]OPF60943.1 hypothetical protein BH725_14710 [Clostridium baratii]